MIDFSRHSYEHVAYHQTLTTTMENIVHFDIQTPLKIKENPKELYKLRSKVVYEA